MEDIWTMSTVIDKVQHEAHVPQGKSSGTIIAAIKESDDSLLIAVDSGGVETPSIKLQSEMKLRKHSIGKIAWACSGDVGLHVDLFSPWLERLTWPPTDWEIFRYELAGKIAEINGGQLRRLRKFDTRIADGAFFRCLLVGWLNGIAEMIEFEHDGRATSSMTDGFQAIGTGKVAAYAVHRTLKHIGEYSSSEESLRVIMDVVIDVDRDCSPPVKMYRVTNEKIEDISLD